jgi:hypothetical protein
VRRRVGPSLSGAVVAVLKATADAQRTLHQKDPWAREPEKPKRPKVQARRRAQPTRQASETR